MPSVDAVVAFKVWALLDTRRAARFLGRFAPTSSLMVESRKREKQKREMIGAARREQIAQGKRKARERKIKGDCDCGLDQNDVIQRD